MPLTELRLEQDQARRRRFTHQLLAILAIIVAATTIQAVLISSVRRQVGDVSRTQQEIQQTQRDGIKRGLILRAVGCRTIQQLGGTFQPGDPCLDAAVRPYFTPDP
jgi:uncharacterized membrane protein